MTDDKLGALLREAYPPQPRASLTVTAEELIALAEQPWWSKRWRRFRRAWARWRR